MQFQGAMSTFSFFKPSKPKTPSELVKATRDAFSALDPKSPLDARVLDKALEEVEKNLLLMKQVLLGDAEMDLNPEQVLQLTSEVCKEDILELLVHKLPNLGWEARKDAAQIWCIFLRQKAGENQCCLEYIENHLSLIDALVFCYEDKETALNGGNMLRECIKHLSLAKYLLESPCFEHFFEYVELSNFDTASDAFATFKELLTRHKSLVYEYLSTHYAQFFGLYDRLISSSNYVTRRQSLKLLGDMLLEKTNAPIMMLYISEVRNLKTMMTLLKDSSKIIQSLAFHLFKVFVANPKKPPPIINVLETNREKLLRFLESFHLDKEDEQFEEEKELVIKEIEGLTIT